MTSGVDLLNGLAVLVGMDRLDHRGRDRWLGQRLRRADRGRARGARRSRPRGDSRRVAGRGGARGRRGRQDRGDRGDRPRGISRVRGYAHEHDVRVLAMPDHPTPVEIKTHVGEPVPFVLAGPGIDHNGAHRFDEAVRRADRAAAGPGPRGDGPPARVMLTGRCGAVAASARKLLNAARTPRTERQTRCLTMARNAAILYRWRWDCWRARGAGAADGWRQPSCLLVAATALTSPSPRTRTRRLRHAVSGTARPRRTPGEDYEQCLAVTVHGRDCYDCHGNESRAPPRTARDRTPATRRARYVAPCATRRTPRRRQRAASAAGRPSPRRARCVTTARAVAVCTARSRRRPASRRARSIGST